MGRTRALLVAAAGSWAIGLGNPAFAQAFLRHHWPLDERSGLTAAEVQSWSDGQLVGFDESGDSQWISAIVDGGLDLSAGVQGCRVLANVPGMSAAESGGFSIALWIRPGPRILEPGEYQILFTPGDGVGLTIVNAVSDGIEFQRVLLFWDGNLANLAVGTTTLEPDTWYHVAVTSTGAGGEKRYFLDGVEEWKQMFRPSLGGVDVANRDGWPAGTISIGAYVDGGRPHDSALDDFRIYEGVLSADEIAALAGAEPPEKLFRRGDANGDGETDIGDAVFVLFYLFLGGQEPGCRESADADDGGGIDLADAISILEYLFLGGPPPPAPGPDCGPDPPGSPADLGCVLYRPCG